MVRVARDNLAMAYQNFAAQKANEGDIQTALTYFGHAMGAGSRPETITLIQKNIAKAYTSLGIQAARSEDYGDSVAQMRHACVVDPNDMTRLNLGIAYTHLAEHYLDQREYENAIAVFEHAMDLGAIFPELLNDYGLALAIAGHKDNAILALQRALRLSPDNEIIQHNLNLVEKGADTGFTIVEIKTEFYLAPLMQQHEYSIAI
jgi:tetratricopeptide (TPR) repeat protein